MMAESGTDVSDIGVADRSTVTVAKIVGGKFGDETQQVLKSLYKRGMTGWGKKHSAFLDLAAGKTGLTQPQIQNWIRRENMKRKHATSEGNELHLPVKKARSQQSWYQHLKNYAQTEDGKRAMSETPATFNKKASALYKSLSSREKEELRNQAPEKKMTRKEVLCSGEKIFQKIQRMFDELEELGFVGFSIGFYEECSQVVGTSATLKCFTPELVEYLHAVVIAANPPPLPSKATLVDVTTAQGCKGYKRTHNASHPSLPDTSSNLPPRDTLSDPPSHDSPSDPPSHDSPSDPPSHDSPSDPPSHDSPSDPPSHDTSSNLPPRDTLSDPLSHDTPSDPKTRDELSDSPINQPSLSSPSPVQGSSVVVSDSPVKPDPKLWLPHLNLYLSDRKIIHSSDRWLTDSIISAAQSILKQQSKQKIYGWMSPQLSKRKSLFLPVPPSSPFIQILHVDGCHWITVSNIASGSQRSDSVYIYDSGSPSRISLAIKRAICSIIRPKADTLHFDLVNVQSQPNGWDCGLFAIAFATELVHGSDPSLCHFDTGTMRQHLLCCLEKGYFSHFPCQKKRRIPLGGKVKKSVEEHIYCTCRQINDKTCPMIACDNCNKWFHKDCSNLDVNKSYKEIKWICSVCANSMASLSK